MQRRAASTTDPPTNQPTKELNWNGGWRDAFRQWRAIAASCGLCPWLGRRQRINVQTHNRNRGGSEHGPTLGVFEAEWRSRAGPRTGMANVAQNNNRG